MTNQELIDLSESLSVVRHLTCSPSFGFALARNNQKLKPIVEALEDAGKLHEDFSAFEKARVDLARQHAAKGGGGEPEVLYGPGGEQHYRIEDDEAWQAALAELRDEHAEAVEARKQQKVEIEALMKVEAEKIEFTMIPHTDFPQGITAAQMECLLPMISG